MATDSKVHLSQESNTEPDDLMHLYVDIYI